ncbi:MAG: antitoxin VapB family protein [Thaumarchaeota archaeon]|nr:antitoxin VapB family protein [Nitrososphaerota archaeon]
MGHRTVTISDEAYRALSRLKNGKESFTDVILRLASSRGSATRLLAYLRELSPSDELARGIEFAMNRTRKATLPKVPLE